MRFLLRLKSGQLFMLVFLAPIIVSFGLNIIFDFNSYGDNAIAGIFGLIYYFVFISWNYQVILRLNEDNNFISEKQIKRVNLFLILIVVTTIYISLPSAFMIRNNAWFSGIITVLLLLSVYGLLFIIYCTAKTIKGSQLGDNLRTADIIIEMIVIGYFFIGLWWLHKKVKRFLNDK